VLFKHHSWWITSGEPSHLSSWQSAPWSLPKGFPPFHQPLPSCLPSFFLTDRQTLLLWHYQQASLIILRLSLSNGELYSNFSTVSYLGIYIPQTGVNLSSCLLFFQGLTTPWGIPVPTVLLTLHSLALENFLNIVTWLSFCDRARVPIYILKNQLCALKYTLKHSLIKNKLISTPTCFGPIRPSSGSCHA